MNQKSKSFLVKLMAIVMLFCCMIGAWFTLPLSDRWETVAKAATTTDVTDTIDLKFESAYSNMTEGADYSADYSGADDICLVGYVGDSVLKANSVLDTGVCWVASASASNPTNNGGVNIMEYIYVNGSSISALSAANAAGTTSYAGTHWELKQGGKRAPVLVETSSTSGLIIRICMAYSNAGEFEIVIKEGFSLLDVDGNTVTVSEDVTFKYANGAVTKVAETTDVTETVTIMGGSYSGAQSQFKIVLSPNSALTSNAWWNINGDSLITANNGVDIMSYIYINGQNIRTLSDANRTNNTYPVGSASGWLGNSDQCRPVFVETVSEGIYVTVLHAFSGTNYTITLKAGFELLNADGGIYTISEDVTFTYNTGTVSKEIEKTDVTETVTITNSSYAENQSQFVIKLNPSATLTSNAWWNINGDSLIATNNGVDIMNYIYINGQNIRTLSDDNRTNNTYPVGSATGWLANSDQCRPVFVETTADGIYVTVLHAFSGTNYTITLKAGFELLNANEDISTISEDVSFLYNAGEISKVQEYVLSFEGLDDTISVTLGQAIGELPEVPAKDGYTGVWQIDGVEITADTVYHYSSNKTAIVSYTKIVERLDVTETVTIMGGSYSEAQSQFKIVLSPNSALTSNAWWNINGDSLITANNGVDIMSYIYINGQNIRALSDDNRTNNTYPVGSASGWLGNSDQCRPAFVETTADGIYVTVLHAFSGTNYTITLKAGFELLNADGNISTISKDINFSSKAGVVSKLVAYTLSFEGLTETKTVFGGEIIGELPVLEEREGYTGEWTIDGVTVTAETVWGYESDKTAVAFYKEKVPTYILSFESTEGTVDSITVEENANLAKLPEVPAKAWHTGIWTINGEEINADTVYVYGEDKTAIAVYTKIETIDVTGILTIEDRDWGAAEDHTALGILVDGSYLVATENLRKYWNDNGETLATLNNGCDIMEYIYINGESVRSIVTKNKKGDTAYTGTTFPLSAGGVYSPVSVETTKSGGVWIRVLKDFASTKYTLTIKKGFTLITETTDILVVSGDITFDYENGKVTKKVQTYTLSFECSEGTVDAITVEGGATLSNLPAVSEKVGYTGKWQIDGETVTASTVYTYGEDKKAIAVYEPIGYTITIVRANGTREEIFFNVENAASKLAEVTLTESNEEYAYSWSEEIPTVLEAKNYTFVEVETDLIPDTRIVSQSVSVGTSFIVNVYVELADENIPQMQFTMGETVVVAEGVLVNEALKKYVYRMENIAAHELAAEFTARLLIGDEEIDCMTYSVEAYLNALAQKEISDELKTLIADIVAYGQAAEAYVEKTNGIQSIDGLTGTIYSELTDTDYKKSASLKEDVEMTSVYVSYADVNRLVVRFTSTFENNLVVKINGNVVTFTEVEEGSGVYEVKTEALYITGCDDRFKVTLSVDDNVVLTLISSVKSYVYEKQNSSNEREANYAKALYNCSVSLRAYAEGV